MLSNEGYCQLNSRLELDANNGLGFDLIGRSEWGLIGVNGALVVGGSGQ